MYMYIQFMEPNYFISQNIFFALTLVPVTAFNPDSDSDPSPPSTGRHHEPPFRAQPDRRGHAASLRPRV